MLGGAGQSANTVYVDMDATQRDTMRVSLALGGLRRALGREGARERKSTATAQLNRYVLLRCDIVEKMGRMNKPFPDRYNQRR